MKKDIQVIRDSIDKVVALLTQSSIKVTQRGMQAYVAYHPKTGAIQSLNVPRLPDDASDQFIAGIQGFIDHEVGHVLFSDSAVLREASKEGGRVMAMANMVEDLYVERMMTKAFTGSTATLDALRKFFVEQMLLPQLREQLAAGDQKGALGTAMVIGFRARGGQTMMADVLKENPDVAALFNPIAEKIGEDLLGRLASTKNSKDCLNLARLVLKRLEEPKEASEPEKKGEDDAEKPKKPKGDKDGAKSDEPPQPADPSECEAPSEDSEVDEPGAADGDDADDEAGDDAPGSGGDASERAETDTSDKRRPDGPSRTDMESEEGGSAGGSDDAPEDGDSSDGERGSESEGDLDDGTGGAGTDSEKESDQPGSDSKGRSREGAGGDLAASEDGTEPAPDGSSRDEPRDPGDTSREDEPDPVGSDALDALEEVEDFDKAVSRALTEAGKTEARDSRYVAFSSDWDEVAVMPYKASESEVVRLADEVGPMVGPLQKQLERAVAAQDKKAWESGLRRGKVNPSALFRTGFGDDRLFRRRHETKAKNTVVSLVVDCSGSMNWSGRIAIAGKAAYALSSTLERLRIRHEVIGFTTKESSPMVRAMRADTAVTGVRYARNEALYMPIFKGFGERLAGDSIARIAYLGTPGVRGMLKENVDGECVQIAHHRLVQQRADKHIMIVLSDGSPACPGDRSAQFRHLKDVVKKIEASGTTVVGIGIETNSVKDFYSRTVVLNSLSDLPTTVVKELSAAILA